MADRRIVELGRRILDAYREPNHGDSPFYHLVPSRSYETADIGRLSETELKHRVFESRRRQIEYRRDVLELCDACHEFRPILKEMCRRDILFWVNTFVVTEDTRLAVRAGFGVIPFCTYPFQDGFFIDAQRSIGKEDLVVLKSRDMGATWVFTIVMLHFWMFVNDAKFLLVSKTANDVDQKNESSALMPKLDILLRNFPKWFISEGDYERPMFRLFNKVTRSSFRGTATVDDVGRSGRYLTIFFDEFAVVPDGAAMRTAAIDAAGSRIYNSTPRGMGNEFAKLVQNDDIRQMRFHWTLHPEKAAGLYYDKKSKPRSPWYDAYCKKAPSPRAVAQELDLDFVGSASIFFPQAMISSLIDKTFQPIYRCRPILDQNVLIRDFVEIEDGPLRFWCPLDGNRRPQPGRYGVGVDVSQGTGASNTVFSIVDRSTGEKVAEMCDAHISVRNAAMLCHAIAYWFCDSNGSPAIVIYEVNGPGLQFERELLNELRFGNIYYREHLGRGFKEVTKTPGWLSGKDSKPLLLAEYKNALEIGRFSNPCVEALEECYGYIYNNSGHIVHEKSQAPDDLSGASDNHGDRVIADALACKVVDAEIMRKAERGGVSENVVDLRNLSRPDNQNCPAYRRWEENQRNSSRGYKWKRA